MSQLDPHADTAAAPTGPTPLTVTSVPRRGDALLLAFGGAGLASYSWLGWAWVVTFALIVMAGPRIADLDLVGNTLLVILLFLLFASLVMFASWPLRVIATLLRCLIKQSWQPRSVTLTADDLLIQTANKHQVLPLRDVTHIRMHWEKILIHQSWGRYLHLHKRDFASEVAFSEFYVTLIRHWAAHL